MEFLSNKEVHLVVGVSICCFPSYVYFFISEKMQLYATENELLMGKSSERPILNSPLAVSAVSTECGVRCILAFYGGGAVTELSSW